MSDRIVEVNASGVWWWCPGCDIYHRVTLAGMDGPEWTFNGDAEKPTISPSVLVNAQGHLNNPAVPRCHCFIRDGHIEFLSDCTHHLAGQTVPLPPFDRKEADHA